jgi:hypothetical protein
MLEQVNKENIENYIEEQEAETSMWQLDASFEELWVDVNLSRRLKNDHKMLTYAENFLEIKESWWFLWWIKLQLLELRLSMTCPYFSEFKDFLVELKKWNDTNEDENSDNLDTIWSDNEFLWTKVSEIESQPFYKNPGTWVTRCAATANFNAKDFWLDLPWWNAYDAWKEIWKGLQKTLPSWRKKDRPNDSRGKISASAFPSQQDKINFADLYTGSSSNYWHRVVWFKDNLWERYVLDPYTRVNGILGNKPHKLIDYTKSRKIVKAHFYNSPWYKFESRQYA